MPLDRKWVKGFGKNGKDQGHRGEWLVISLESEREVLKPLFEWALSARHLPIISDLPPLPFITPTIPVPSPSHSSVSSFCLIR